MKGNFFLCLVAAAFTVNNPTSAEKPPDTPKKPVTTEYHGVTVEDPYQWLEAEDDSQVKAWSDAQNQRTRKSLDSFPDRPAIEKQLQENIFPFGHSFLKCIHSTDRCHCFRFYSNLIYRMVYNESRGFSKTHQVNYAI